MLRRVGVEIHFQCPNPAGHRSMGISEADAAAYAVGAINLPARLSGMSPDEFADWMHSGGYMCCHALTRAGRRCKNLVRGHQVTDSAEWKRLLEEKPYCAKHGG